MLGVFYFVLLRWDESVPVKFRLSYWTLNFTTLFLSVNQKQTNIQTN